MCGLEVGEEVGLKVGLKVGAGLYVMKKNDNREYKCYKNIVY